MRRQNFLILLITLLLFMTPSALASNLIFFDSSADWLTGDLYNLTFSAQMPQALELRQVDGQYSDYGVFESPVLKSEYSFKSLVPTWNVITPGDTYIMMEVQVLLADEIWSGYQVLGIWGQNTTPRSINMSSYFDGYPHRVNIDIFEIMHEPAASKYQLKITLYSDGEHTPILFGLGATTYDRNKSYSYPEVEKSAYLRELKVPMRSQMIEDPVIAARICSPTSLAMVLEYLGHNETTASVAKNAYDAGARIYGNWSFAAAYAGSLGFRAYIDYYSSLDGIRYQIAKGNPVICSIRFRANELQNSPIASTGGHLVLVTGFKEIDGEEWLIVNDPAAPDNETVRREYRADEFFNAWIGIVYIIETVEL